MKNIHFFAFAVFLSYHAAIGQITTMEEPISFRFRSDIPILTRSERTMKSFAALDMEKIEREDAEDERNGRPPRFGYPHQVNYNLDNSGEWITLPNGDRIWRLVISCQGARSINLLYDRFWIPDGAKFFVYSNDRSQVIGAVTSANNKGDRENIQGFATGLVFGDQITLEYYLPSDVRETGIISVSSVVHGYRSTCLATEYEYGCSGSCQVNINCDEGNNWQNEKNAVAMILVNGIRSCTGSLVNTTANDGSPLFLTADHCLEGGDAIDAPDLNHWSFYWHYESPGCTSVDIILPPSTVGATVLANRWRSVSDFALLRLTEDPRNAPGVTPYYLGWDRSGNAGIGGVGIHHPRGDLKKIATHNQTPQHHSITGGGTNNYWHLYWMQTPNGYSVTESGSSGSPLLNNNRHIIGQLLGGTSINCSNPANDYAIYGKFSVSWTGNNNNSPQRRLRDWLDPIETGVLVLDGCSGVTEFTNQNVITNTSVVGCNSINVNNTTVTPSGTLNIRATNAVNIGDGFTVQQGGGLNIDVGP